MSAGDTPPRHPARRLDDAVHQRTRLGMLAVLAEAEAVDFAFLRDTLELTDGNLSSNVARLERLGYVRVEKRVEGRRTRTWLSLTPAGGAALEAEVGALRELIAGVERHVPRGSLRPT